MTANSKATPLAIVKWSLEQIQARWREAIVNGDGLKIVQFEAQILALEAIVADFQIAELD